MEDRRTTYWNSIIKAITSLWVGLKLTIKHFIKARKSRKPIAIHKADYFEHTEGINTVQYPHAMQPIPDNGRYRLHNEIDDCIVCDKCAKICPVDCITIEPIKAIEEIGKTSDGTPKRIYAAKFDIDIGQCCFCGLCTTVCPTECLTMTKVFDFSVTDMKDHHFAFAEMTEVEIAEKKQLAEEHQKNKVAARPQPVSNVEEKRDSAEPSVPSPKPVAKPIFRPKIKPPGTPPTT